MGKRIFLMETRFLGTLSSSFITIIPLFKLQFKFSFDREKNVGEAE